MRCEPIRIRLANISFTKNKPENEEEKKEIIDNIEKVKCDTFIKSLPQDGGQE